MNTRSSVGYFQDNPLMFGKRTQDLSLTRACLPGREIRAALPLHLLHAMCLQPRGRISFQSIAIVALVLGGVL